MASSAPTRQRLDPEVFRLPAERIREGYYSDAYFNQTKALLDAFAFDDAEAWQGEGHRVEPGA